MNPKIHYRTQKCPPLSLSCASLIQSTYSHPTTWRSILVLHIHLPLGLPSGLFHSGFHTNTLYPPLLPIRATWAAHLILIDFITRTLLGEECRSFSFSLWDLLHSPITLSLLGPNIPFNDVFSNTWNFLPPSISATKFHTHTKQQAKLDFYTY